MARMAECQLHWGILPKMRFINLPDFLFGLEIPIDNLTKNNNYSNKKNHQSDDTEAIYFYLGWKARFTMFF